MSPRDVERSEATVYHHYFEDPNAPGERYEVGADLGMGYEFAVEHGADPADVFDEAYEEAGTLTVDYEAGTPGDAVAGLAYAEWEDGRGRNPQKTRSMAVGDVIAVDGVAYFVDRIGFEPIDVDV